MLSLERKGTLPETEVMIGQTNERVEAEGQLLSMKTTTTKNPLRYNGRETELPRNVTGARRNQLRLERTEIHNF